MFTLQCVTVPVRVLCALLRVAGATVSFVVCVDKAGLIPTVGLIPI